MNTKLATKEIRLNEWAGIIKSCRASGLKVDDYCRQHDISRDAYYYWLRKVKEKALQEENVLKNIEGKEIVKVIVVPNKIVNIVVK